MSGTKLSYADTIKLSNNDVVKHAVAVRQALLNCSQNEDEQRALTLLLDEVQRAREMEEVLVGMAYNLFAFAATFNRETDSSWRAMLAEYRDVMKRAGRAP